MISSLKIYILTSDIDAIEKFRSNKRPNTHIIELSSNTTTNDSPSNEDTDGTKLIDLDNVTCDQGQKRMKRKNNDLVCVVCSGRASGYHYGASTCNSCKVFFTRNGRLSLDEIHCRHGQDRCQVSHDIRHKCTKCRLVRCFTRGMQTSYFVTEKTKQHDENASLPIVPRSNMSSELINENDDVRMDSNEMINPFSHVLPMKDWLAIQSIQSSYLLAFQGGFTPSLPDLSDPFNAISCWSQIKDQIVLHFITFFRHIDEFSALNISDRCTLVKSNFFNLTLLYLWSNYDVSMGPLADLPEEVQAIFRNWITNSPHSMKFFHRLADLSQSFQNITEREPTLLRLVCVMTLFSTDVFMANDKLRLNDSPAIHRAQSYYARLIWNYLMDKYSEQKAIRQGTQLMDFIARMQFLTKQHTDFIRAKLIAVNMVDRLSPLMQNALDIP